MPPSSPRGRCALTAPFHPCLRLATPAVFSLLHCPSSHLDWPLSSTLPCGARTFLDGRPQAPAATTCPARAPSTTIAPPHPCRDDRGGTTPRRRGYAGEVSRAVVAVAFLASFVVSCAAVPPNGVPAAGPRPPSPLIEWNAATGTIRCRSTTITVPEPLRGSVRRTTADEVTLV